MLDINNLLYDDAPAPESHTEHNIEAAASFLNRLDPNTTEFTFQTFDDNKERKDKNLTRVLNGTLENNLAVLVSLNDKGAGIFVTVNKTDLKGRKKENIKRIRTVFIEDDNGNAPELPMTPQMVVESSPGKYHKYLLTDSDKLDEFNSVQQVLVNDYGSDANAKDMSRVLRLPGFFHNKSEPFLVHIESINNESAYSWEDIKKSFPPVVNGSAVSSNSDSVNVIDQNSLPDALKKSALAAVPLHVMYKDMFENNQLNIYSALECAECSDMSRDEWLSIGMALYHSSARGGRDEAFKLWDKWSSKDKRYDAKEMQGKWDGFGNYSGETVGLGTLFKVCEAHGWTGNYYQNETAHKLALQERKHVYDDYNSKHGMLNADGKVVVVKRTANSGGGLKTVMTPVSSERDMCRNKFIAKPEKKQTVTNGTDGYVISKTPLFDYWLSQSSRRTFSGIEFKPKGGLVAGGTELPDGEKYNLYTGMTITPVKADVSKYNLILKHIKDTWCSGDKDMTRYILWWFANMVQNPGTQGKTLIVLRSGEGCGKNIIVDMFLRIFGQAGIQVTSQNDVTGQFNDFLFTSVFVHLNEAVFGGSHVAAGQLKSLITDDHLTVERKYMSKFCIKNCSHIMISSNADWCAPIGVDDRRYVNLDLDESVKGNKTYFRDLAAQTHNDGQSAFLHFLLNMDLKNFDPTEIPEAFNRASATRLDNKLRTADTVTQWWHEILHDGDIVLHNNNPGSITHVIEGDWYTGSVQANVSQMHEAYKRWCKDMNARQLEHKDCFGKKLHNLVPGLIKKRVRSGISRVHKYDLPELADCRNYFSNVFIKQDIEW